MSTLARVFRVVLRKRREDLPVYWYGRRCPAPDDWYAVDDAVDFPTASTNGPESECAVIRCAFGFGATPEAAAESALDYLSGEAAHWRGPRAIRVVGRVEGSGEVITREREVQGGGEEDLR